MSVGRWYPVLCRLRRKKNKITRSARMAIPPTTPPTIMPKFVDFPGEPLAEGGAAFVGLESPDFPGRPLAAVCTTGLVAPELLEEFGVDGAADVAVPAPSRVFGFTTRNSRVRGVLVLVPWYVTSRL